MILPEWIMIIWHESLFHAGAKSREKQDMRFFHIFGQIMIFLLIEPKGQQMVLHVKMVIKSTELT